MSQVAPAYVYRDATAALKAAVDDFPVVVLTGLRQSGKTTLLREEPVLAQRAYVTLDDLGQLQAARSDPAGFIAGAESLTIDEAQRCPDLLLAIKAAVDRRRKPGQFVLSGSAQIGLAAGVSESLAGRAAYLDLHPMTLRERHRRSNDTLFLRGLFAGDAPPTGGNIAPVTAEEILRGGMPAVCLGVVQDREAWFRAYEQTYLERDVRDLARIGDLIPFRNLLRLAALRTGQILNISDLARDAKLSTATATRYLSVLEASFVMRRVPPFLGNRASRLIKGSKLYLGDSGIAAHLAGVDEVGPRSDEPMRGALYETFVAQNLAALLAAHWPRATLSFWNVQGRHEVDFVIEVGRDCLAVEVKTAARVSETDLGGLRAFLASTPRCRAAVLAYNGPTSMKLADRIWAIPLRQVMA